MWSSLHAIARIYFCASTLIVTSESFGNPILAQLIEQAPRIRSTDPETQKIDIMGTVVETDGVSLDFRIRYQWPNRFAISVNDGRDKAVLYRLEEDTAILYDPVDNCIIWSNGFSFKFKVDIEDDRFHFQIDMSKSNDKSSYIDFDIKSLFSTKAPIETIEPIGQGMFKLVRTSDRGNSMVGYVDLTRRCPFIRVDFIKHGSIMPLMTINCKIDDQVKDAWPIHIPKDELKQQFNVKDFSKNDFFTNLSINSYIFKICYIRDAISNPKHRSFVEDQYKTKFDWDALKKNDDDFVRKLNNLLNAAGRKR